jgi:mRNA interferase MazF
VKASGQIVLFRVPRTDLSAGKLRPALLISEAPGPYDDWLICMISSQQHQQIEGFDERIEEGDTDFQQSGLKTTSVVRISRLAVVEGDVLEGRIGRISSDRMQRIRRRLAEWIQSKENGSDQLRPA